MLLAVAACGSGSDGDDGNNWTYTTDTKGFFGSGNRQGAAAGVQAKAALDAAAQFFGRLGRHVLCRSRSRTGSFRLARWRGNLVLETSFPQSETGFNNAALNVEVAANEYVVFAGARDLPGDQLRQRRIGGMVEGFVTRSGTLTNAEDAELDQMEVAFRNATKRGQATGIGRWGGSAAFDNLTTWHFNHTTNPLASETDFYSVRFTSWATRWALVVPRMDALVSDNDFTEPTSRRYSAIPRRPLATDDAAHRLLGIAASPVLMRRPERKRP